MISIEALRDQGVDVKTGLALCMNNEAFYLRLVAKALEDVTFEKLVQAIEAGDLNTAFEAAHALKGVMANLSLTPIHEPVAEITELLRSRTEMDYSEHLRRINEGRERLRNL